MMRINYSYAYHCVMKARLNLTIEETLLEQVKRYADQKQQSISELVESYFKSLTRPSRKQNIVQLIDQLKSPGIPADLDLTEQYYKDNAGKYGF